MPRYDVSFRIRGKITIDGIKASSPEEAIKEALVVAEDGDASLDYTVREDTGDATEVSSRDTTEEETEKTASSSADELTSREQRRADRRAEKREKRTKPSRDTA